jgi:hypothetical protein
MLLTFSHIEHYEGQIVYRDEHGGRVEFIENKTGDGFKARYRDISNDLTRPVQISSIRVTGFPAHVNMIGIDEKFILWGKESLSVAPDETQLRAFLKLVAW